MWQSVAIQSGIPMARVELLDEVQVRVCNVHSKLSMPEVPTLFVEFHGSPASVAEQSERFGEIARDCGGGHVRVCHGVGAAQSSLADPPRRFLGSEILSRRRSSGRDGRVCTDLAARRMRGGHEGRYRAVRNRGAHRCACWRRKFPCLSPCHDGRPARGRPDEGLHGARCASVRSQWRARAPESTELVRPRSTFSSRSTGTWQSMRCGRSSKRSIRRGS